MVKTASSLFSKAAQLRPQPSQQHRHLEGLGDVVVGAGVEAAHDVHLAVRAGQHDDRHPVPLLAQARTQVAAVAVR